MRDKNKSLTRRYNYRQPEMIPSIPSCLFVFVACLSLSKVQENQINLPFFFLSFFGSFFFRIRILFIKQIDVAGARQ
ncbi:hypothetical protein BDW62DRAFT_187655 [Aspergillus aurantiobrunneus]